MIRQLPQESRTWVNETLHRLSMEERLAQLLLPTLGGGYAELPKVEAFLRSVQVGGVFVGGATTERHQEVLHRLQGYHSVPLVVAADLERGAGPVIVDKPMFPDPLAVAAANDLAGARLMGEAAATEGRRAGIHWTFAPVADVNRNPFNPIANTRSLGDDPHRVSALVRAIMTGLQENGMAACAKHFPGDGIDDLDQHISTSVNSLSMDEWHEVSGLPFAEAIRAGIWTIMAGHIALPALDKSRNICGSPCPGTLSHAILTDLLRGTLGFEGLVVSDDMNMGGVVGYATRRDRVIGAIRAGCDMYLFPKLPDDYDTLRDALRAGELSEARVTEACRRVLELKARLGLDQTTEPPVILEDREPVQMEAARRIAEGALVCVKDCRNLIPLRQLKPGARVLTMTFAQENFPFCDLPEIDKELTRRGFQVEHRMNPCECKIFETFSDFEAVFVNFNFRATWAYGSARSVGVHNRTFLGGFQFEHPAAVFTSFGSPYLLLDYPNLPNLINVHANDPASQKAAVAAWFGDLPFSGVSPVANLERTFK